MKMRVFKVTTEMEPDGPSFDEHTIIAESFDRALAKVKKKLLPKERVRSVVQVAVES